MRDTGRYFCPWNDDDGLVAQVYPVGWGNSPSGTCSAAPRHPTIVAEVAVRKAQFPKRVHILKVESVPGSGPGTRLAGFNRISMHSIITQL